MIILISGDRNWNNIRIIAKYLIATIKYLYYKQNSKIPDFLPDNIYIIEGAASGADTLGAQVAISIGIPKSNIIEIPAPWRDIEGKPANQIGYTNGKPYWKAAGLYRNNLMIKHNPDIVLAFHNNISQSKGTKNMIDIAIKNNVEYLIISEETKIEDTILKHFYISKNKKN